MCLFSCGERKGGQEEEEIVIPARPVQPPMIIRSTTMTTRPLSLASRDGIVLKQISPRVSRTSQVPLILERRISSSGSPRVSNQQVVVFDDRRNSQISPTLTPNPSGAIIRHGPGPLQRNSPRTSTGRVHFIESEPARVAAGLLRSNTSHHTIPQHRRSTSQVLVIQRSPSQRIRASGPRHSDSVLVNINGSTFATGQVIAPTNTSINPRFVQISPRSSRLSQLSGNLVEIETAGGRSSRRNSNVQAICTDANARGSGTWRPVREEFVVVDSRGNRTEYYR